MQAWCKRLWYLLFLHIEQLLRHIQLALFDYVHLGPCTSHFSAWSILTWHWAPWSKLLMLNTTLPRCQYPLSILSAGSLLIQPCTMFTQSQKGPYSDWYWPTLIDWQCWGLWLAPQTEKHHDSTNPYLLQLCHLCHIIYLGGNIEVFLHPIVLHL